MAAAGLPRPPSALMDTKTSDGTTKSERGATAVEYGLLIVGIAAAVVLVIVALGGNVFGLFDDSCSSLAEQSGSTC
jgi:pilus assembly protein Flp/PilA